MVRTLMYGDDGYGEPTTIEQPIEGQYLEQQQYDHPSYEKQAVQGHTAFQDQGSMEKATYTKEC